MGTWQRLVENNKEHSKIAIYFFTSKVTVNSESEASPFFLFETDLLCHPGWNAMVQSQLTATSVRLQVAEITGVCHNTQLIFVFLVEMGFLHVDQDGLDILTS